MITAISFALAAAAGAWIRAVLRPWNERYPLPVGTLAVNLAGSFALGVAVGWDRPVATVAGTAFLGSLTTFSTLAGELAERRRRDAIAYAVISVLGGVILAWLGLHV